MTTDTKERDWQGNEITQPEDDATVINVWEIEPAIGTDYDLIVVRDYHRAQDIAGEQMMFLMDDGTEDELLESPCVVSVRLKKMSLGDYRSLPR